MFSPLTITSSVIGLVSTTAAYGATFLSGLTAKTTPFLETARQQWIQFNELTNPNTATRVFTFDIFKNTTQPAAPLLQSGVGLWVGLGAIAAALIGGAILRSRKPSILQTHPGPEILMGPPVLKADQAVPPPVEEQALPPQRLNSLAERQQVLSERTWGYAKIIDRSEGWECIKRATSEWKYALVQLSDGSYELRVSPPYTEHRDREIKHHQLLFLSEDERLVGAGYLVYKPEPDIFLIDGMSAMFPTDADGPRGSPWYLSLPAKKVGLKAAVDILKQKFGIHIRHVWSVTHPLEDEERA